MVGMTTSRLAAATRLTPIAADQHRPQHARARDAGREQRRHFMMALDPRDGEHHGHEREDAARAIEERDRAVGVVADQHAEQAAVLVGVVDEVVEVAEGIDHDVQPDEAQKADDQHLHELTQHVAVDDRGHECGDIAGIECKRQRRSSVGGRPTFGTSAAEA